MSQFTSLSTGPGSEITGDWMTRSHVASNMASSRGPPPTSAIPMVKGNPVSMSSLSEQSWAPKFANSFYPQPVNSTVENFEGSHIGPLVSASLESTQDTVRQNTRLRSLLSEEGDDSSQLELSEASEDDGDLGDAKFAKPAYKRGRKGKEKKKVGRPIAYRGDPNAPELTDQERRRIKRRIANRESARRVRHKRQEELEDMQIKMEQIQAHNSHLQQHVANVKEQKEMLAVQLHEVQHKFEDMSKENNRLTAEIQALRQSLQLKMSALEYELDKRATEAEGTVSHSAFSNPTVQHQPLMPSSQAQPVTTNQLPLEGVSCAAIPLDWLPSLSFEDFTHMDIVNHFFEEGPAPGMCIKREMGELP